MTHTIEEARRELAAAREAGRGPAGWALELAEGVLAREGAASSVSEADLDALDDAVFGSVSTAEVSESTDPLEAVVDALFKSREQ